MCIINLNRKCFKTTISIINSIHICWKLDVSFTSSQARSHGGRFRVNVLKFCCAQKKSLFETYRNKNKNLAPLTVYFVLLTWLQACFMPVYTFTLVAFLLLSLQMLVISVHISFLQLVGIESGTSQLV